MTSNLLKFSPEEKSKLSAALLGEAVVKVLGEIKATEDGSNSFEVIFTSGAVDRHGEIVNPDGWDFTNYMNNPVVLYAHDYSSLPVGKVESIDRKEDKWMAKGVFAPEDASPMAGYVSKLYKAGFLKTVSVGFLPTEMDAEFNALKQELLEISFVPVPANPEALSLAKQLGLDIDDLKAKGILKEVEIKADEPPTEEPKPEEPKPEDDSSLEQKCMAILSDCSDKIRQAIVAEAEKQKTAPAPVEKAGRTLSEKNRSLIRDSADGMRSAILSMEKCISALEDLHSATEPSSGGEPAPSDDEQKSADRDMVFVQRLIRIADKSIEDALRIANRSTKKQ